MDIVGKTVVVLGGWGLVGSSVCRRLVEEKPERIVVTSLKESEAKDAVAELEREFSDNSSTTFAPWWGNIFGRDDERESLRDELLADPKSRRRLISDVIDDLSEDLLESSSLYRLLIDYRPDAVVDCVNTSTAIAYQDIFASTRGVLKAIDDGRAGAEEIERLLATLYIPQLIRHVQILYKGLQDAGSSIYVKIGTAGSGGMGLNIPYTHSEERPSRVLLSKSSIAGAHTLLLFLMARTPGGPVIKEIKPTATIAWKRIADGEVMRRGRPIPLVDCPIENATELSGRLSIKPQSGVSIGENLRAPFIDTGENGIFSKGEFEAITALGQMEMITPEEIAEAVVQELRGGNTGDDIVAALDSAVYGPTYRGGYLRNRAVSRLAGLEEASGRHSVAFEMLGPPRLSKLLYESYLLGIVAGSIDGVLETTAPQICAALDALVASNKNLRTNIISIGIPILLGDGKRLLRGESIKIPPFRGEWELDLDSESIDHWASQGWVDLRQENIERWQSRLARIKAETDALPVDDTSSRIQFSRDYWEDFATMPAGKIVAWIFTVEDEGARMKA